MAGENEQWGIGCRAGVRVRVGIGCLLVYRLSGRERPAVEPDPHRDLTGSGASHLGIVACDR